MPYQTFRQLKNFSLKIAKNKFSKDLLSLFTFSQLNYLIGSVILTN